VTREVKQWSDQIDADLQDALSDVNWDIRSSFSDVSEFTDVASFITTLADTIVPTVKLGPFPNHKTRAGQSIRDALNPALPSTLLWPRIRPHGRRTQRRLNADASLEDDLDAFHSLFEASNNSDSGTVAEVSSMARDEHTLCDRA